MANESSPVGNRGSGMGSGNPLPPLHLAIERARQIAEGQGLGDQMAELEDHEAVRRAKEFSARMEQFAGESKARKAFDAASLAYEHRKMIEEGKFSVFLIPFVAAIVKDGLIDTAIANIPIVGWIFGPFLGLPITIYLFIFTWGRGVWKLRAIIWILWLLDYIPAVDLIPMTTLGVAWIFLWSVGRAKKARGELGKLGMK